MINITYNDTYNCDTQVFIFQYSINRYQTTCAQYDSWWVMGVRLTTSSDIDTLWFINLSLEGRVNAFTRCLTLPQTKCKLLFFWSLTVSYNKMSDLSKALRECAHIYLAYTCCAYTSNEYNSFQLTPGQCAHSLSQQNRAYNYFLIWIWQ